MAPSRLTIGHKIQITASIGLGAILLAGVIFIGSGLWAANGRIDELSDRVGALEVEVRALPQAIVDALREAEAQPPPQQ